jgi:lipoprotein-anchoring transpeptidase ErfK/SrfK
VGGSITTGFIIMVSLLGFILLMFLSPKRIPSGVSVAGLSLSGKTPAEAQQYLAKNLPDDTITATDGSRQWSLKLSDLGVKLDASASLKAAENAATGARIPAYYTVDLNQTQNGLVALSTQANVAATVDKPGRAIEIPVMLDRLRVDVTGELADKTLDLNMIETQPLKPDPDFDPPGSTGARTVHVVQPGQELGLIAKEFNVDVSDIIKLNAIENPNLIYVGQKLTIPAGGVYQPTQADAPPAPAPTGKAILVSTFRQRIFAYEDGRLVRSHLVSTGLPDTPTVLGDYKVKVKFQADDMSGPGYFLPKVPYTMYFFQGYAIHGTYWHNSFGRPMSHGCVNLPTDEAKWFFDWAEVGTPVKVV